VFGDPAVFFKKISLVALDKATVSQVICGIISLFYCYLFASGGCEIGKKHG
jgi:hypothetical protein